MSSILMSMRALFSFVSLLVVIGLIAWFSVKSMSLTSEQNAVQNDISTGVVDEPQNILTPLQDAKNAKELIESRNRQSVGGM